MLQTWESIPKFGALVLFGTENHRTPISAHGSKPNTLRRTKQPRRSWNQCRFKQIVPQWFLGSKYILGTQRCNFGGPRRLRRQEKKYGEARALGYWWELVEVIFSIEWNHCCSPQSNSSSLKLPFTCFVCRGNTLFRWTHSIASS